MKVGVVILAESASPPSRSEGQKGYVPTELRILTHIGTKTSRGDTIGTKVAGASTASILFQCFGELDHLYRSRYRR